MIKTISVFLFLITSNNNPHVKSHKNSGFISIGSNSTQKIYYSTSSKFSENNDGQRAIDNNKKSSWISKKNSVHWLEINFGVKRIMNKIIVYPGKKDNYYTIKGFTLQFKYRSKWFDYASISLEELEESCLFDSIEYKEKAVINLGGIDASTFRIYIPDDQTYKGYAAISEIEVYIGSYKLEYFDNRLKNMFFPVINGFLPNENSSYPNAPRNYRGGKHAGLDIYHYHSKAFYKPIEVDMNTPVHAAKDGVIIRADHEYKPFTRDEWINHANYYKTHPRTFVKRSFGGIQVWIDHEDGVVTTYNHLSRIDDKIKEGVRVNRGERIGWIGNSGLIGEAEGKDYGVHLHFEIWIDGNYLGYGMKLKDIKNYLLWIFFNQQ